MMSLYPPFLYVPFLELFFQVTHSLSKFFGYGVDIPNVRNVRWSRKKLYTAKIYVGISFNRQLALLSLYLGLMLHWPRTSCCRAQVRGSKMPYRPQLFENLGKVNKNGQLKKVQRFYLYLPHQSPDFKYTQRALILCVLYQKSNNTMEPSQRGLLMWYVELES